MWTAVPCGEDWGIRSTYDHFRVVNAMTIWQMLAKAFGL